MFTSKPAKTSSQYHGDFFFYIHVEPGLTKSTDPEYFFGNIFRASKAFGKKWLAPMPMLPQLVLQFGSSQALRIDDAVQVERRRPHWSLTQHHVHLRSMVRLVIEQVTARHMSRFHVVFAPIVRVRERPVPKSRIHAREEHFDPRVLPRSRTPQGGKVRIKNLVWRRRHALPAF